MLSHSVHLALMQVRSPPSLVVGGNDQQEGENYDKLSENSRFIGIEFLLHNGRVRGL